MATVTVDINGRPYAVGCADGQEERVRTLAQQFDVHVRQISGEVGHGGDLRLFLMASLMLADELQEARQRLEKGQGPVPQNGPVKAPPPPAGDGVAEALNAVAARIEKICQTI